MALDDQIRDVHTAVKPKLRGWLHAGIFPVAVLAGVAFVAVAPTPAARVSGAIYTATAALLFGISALYHRGRWSPRMRAVLRRFDHANIFLIIAGTYTPFTILVLDSRDAQILLSLVWIGAITGALFRVFWLSAPRWLYVPIYLGLGWAATFWLPSFGARGGVAVLTLIIIGGLLYSAGAIVYALKRPDPSPRWFGFHEIFHACTLAGFLAHHVGVWLAAFGVGAAVTV
jgi:hemolysin III